MYDVAVIGGGFYGSVLADVAAGMKRRVALVDREPRLLARASFANQARIHNGYHYPRAFTTGLRSRENYGRFRADFEPSVVDTTVALYAIGRARSKTGALQFRRFCGRIGAPLRPARPQLRRLFDPTLVADAFEVEETVFDANELRALLERRLANRDVNVLTGRSVERVVPAGRGARLILGDGVELAARRVINATYSSVNRLARDVGGIGTPLKHEVAEVALVEVPPELDRVGITVMDGPFFSLLPFPAARLHSLTHVTYTPRESWLDIDGPVEPTAVLRSAPRESRLGHMRRDAARYVPELGFAVHRESLFEVKTVPAVHEIDDGRPILFRNHEPALPMISVLGSKLDNIYDVLPGISSFLVADAA